MPIDKNTETCYNAAMKNKTKHTNGIKVLFTDFDGVLNNDKEFLRWRSTQDHEGLPCGCTEVNECIDPMNVEQLNRVIRETGCEIVVSSTWREFFSNEWLTAHLKKFGFIGEIKYRTKNTERGGWGNRSLRCDEIRHWLQNSGIKVDRYAIVDDLEEADTGEGRFVMTFDKHGLRKQEADKIIALLNDSQDFVTNFNNLSQGNQDEFRTNSGQ